MREERERLLDMYRAVRQASLDMCRPLKPEDYQVQPMEEVSPPKWNLGHTSWFFWQFILGPRGRSLPVDEAYKFLLNSYYHRAGKRGLRGTRGLRTRPAVEEIYDYRRSVDERVEGVIASADERDLEDLGFLMTVGVNHEQQHQELFYTEIKNIYSANVRDLRPAYRPTSGTDHQQAHLPVTEAGPSVRNIGTPEFIPFAGGVCELGNIEGEWCWDNELGVHKAFLDDFALQNRLVTNGEMIKFIEDGGYSNSILWLSDGWFEVERQQWAAPLYWEKIGSEWWTFTLSGMNKVDPIEPVCHVSYYEADAYARWKSEVDHDFEGVRLPTEREWEHAARISAVNASEGNFVEDGVLHPVPAKSSSPGSMAQMLGDVWEWTSSHYEPYPGFKEFPDNLSEYNGKFMNNQRVLRGGSCVTPRNHIRMSYRNFWPPATRFQFSGIRLARHLGGRAHAHSSRSIS
jgi:ergothioneine biosynthesis protein EgtB